jgi:hypothetical protein
MNSNLYGRISLVVLASVGVINCSTGANKVKGTTDPTASEFQFTRNDSNDCRVVEGRQFCPDLKALNAELNKTVPGAVSNRVRLDVQAVTNLEYDQCVRDLQCDTNTFYRTAATKSLSAGALPAVGLPYESAMHYCAWAGERLATMAELRTGAADSSFKKSEYAEWSNDWALSPGASCVVNGRNLCEPANPMGICSGIFPCDKSLKLKQVLNSDLSGQTPTHYTTRGKIAFRCASDSETLTKAPPWMLQNPPAPLGNPSPISESQRNLLHNLEATDTLNKPICKAKYTSPAHCKDPVTYFTPNESQNYQFAPYIRNLGGGYAGVAADANYSYIAVARSRFVWLFDFDVNINALHRILRAMILESETVTAFLQKFERRNLKTSLEILGRYYKDRTDLDFIQQVFRNNYSSLHSHYRASAAPDRRQGEFGWLRFAEHYEYIRLLYQQDRIAIVPGDMLKDKSMQSIGKSARALGIPIRVYYPSNAEEFWTYRANNGNYKKNILSMPFDEASITFRSVHEYPWHPARRHGFKGFWHYVVHGAYNYQKRLLLPHYDLMNDFKMHRVLSPDRADFSTIEIPSSIPRGILEQEK